jgi:hypothetical protein
MNARRGYRMRTLVDKVTGKRSRVRVVRHHGFLGYWIHWTQACSGCAETPEGHMPDAQGMGCSECGYTGKRRHTFFCPFDVARFDTMIARREREKQARTASSGGAVP